MEGEREKLGDGGRKRCVVGARQEAMCGWVRMGVVLALGACKARLSLPVVGIGPVRAQPTPFRALLDVS